MQLEIGLLILYDKPTLKHLPVMPTVQIAYCTNQLVDTSHGHSRPLDQHKIPTVQNCIIFPPNGFLFPPKMLRWLHQQSNRVDDLYL